MLGKFLETRYGEWFENHLCFEEYPLPLSCPEKMHQHGLVTVLHSGVPASLPGNHPPPSQV